MLNGVSLMDNQIEVGFCVPGGPRPNYQKPSQDGECICPLTKFLLTSVVSSCHNNLWSLMKLSGSFRPLNFRMPWYQQILRYRKIIISITDKF